MIFFKLGVGSAEKVYIQAIDSGCPIEGFLPKGMRFAWASGSSVEDLVGWASMEDSLLLLRFVLRREVKLTRSIHSRRCSVPEIRAVGSSSSGGGSGSGIMLMNVILRFSFMRLSAG